MARRTAPIGVPPSGGIFDPPPLFPPNFELLGAYSGWRNDWSHIVAGQFTAGLYSSLLFYEQSTGHAEFYETNGQGGMTGALLIEQRSEEHTSELQSHLNLVCRLLLEKKKIPSRHN